MRDRSEIMQHFKLLSYMKKPKPWKEVDKTNDTSDRRKAQNVARICRRLMAVHAESMFMKCQRTPVRLKKRYKRKKIEPPFLIRNCISGQKHWEDYMKKAKYWAERKKKNEDQTDCSFVSSVQDESFSVENSNQFDNTQTNSSATKPSAALLRSFYTIWHIRYISKKSLRTEEEFERALEELSNSPVVEKSLQKTPKGGINAEVITDKTKLSKRALQTLTRWARLVENVEDGYESGYDDLPIQLWNRAVNLANTSQGGNDSLNVTETTTNTACSSSTICSNLSDTPRIRRSKRLSKASNCD